MSNVTNLPRARQRTHTAAIAGDGHAAAQENLTRAFLTFTQAAGSLEKSYTQLQAEVSRLHVELQKTNSELERSLEENARVRGYLARVVENLPCGVRVVSATEQVQIIIPEARRLLAVTAEWVAAGRAGGLPLAFASAIREFPANSFFCEQEISVGTNANSRAIGILRASIGAPADGAGDTIWIVRDITEQKRVACERESARKSLALAEIATVLAHEIRNPLGSMELFTGLLGMPPRICRKRGSGSRTCRRGCGRCRPP
jgi:two-component system, sensor histidine kinase FlrB